MRLEGYLMLRLVEKSAPGGVQKVSGEMFEAHRLGEDDDEEDENEESKVQEIHLDVSKSV